MQGRNHGGGDLHNEPADDRIRDWDSVDISPLQSGEKAAFVWADHDRQLSHRHRRSDNSRSRARPLRFGFLVRRASFGESRQCRLYQTELTAPAAGKQKLFAPKRAAQSGCPIASVCEGPAPDERSLIRKSYFRSDSCGSFCRRFRLGELLAQPGRSSSRSGTRGARDGTEAGRRADLR